MPVEGLRSLVPPPAVEVKPPAQPLAIGTIVSIQESGQLFNFRVDQDFQGGEAFSLLPVDASAATVGPIVLKPFTPTGNMKDVLAEQEAFLEHQQLLIQANAAGVPHIPQARGYLHIDQGPNEGWYSMEQFRPGIGLDDFLQTLDATRPASVKLRLQLFEQLAEAVAALHAVPPSGIVHRDVNPGNVLVAPDGSITLIDFSASGRSGISQGYTRMFFASDGYRPLEQMQFTLPPQPSNDAYALGMILYHMFGGNPSDQALVDAAHRANPLVSPVIGQPEFTIIQSTHPDIANIIVHATQINPQNRDQTATVAQVLSYTRHALSIR